MPIDYWDYLGWKDTLAIPGHSARQRAYAHVRGDRDVYTPQVVVNGSMDALGSDRPYRKKSPPNEVAAYLRKEAGRLFDPKLVELFLSVIDE